MVDYCSLYKILSTSKYRKIKNTEVYGYITRDLPLQSYLKDNELDSDVRLVEVAILGIKFLGEDSVQALTGDCNQGKIYMANSYMCTYVKNSVPSKDWYTFRGNLSIPRGFDNICNMLSFSKGTRGWKINATPVSDIITDNFSTNPRLLQSIMNSANAGRFLLPKDARQTTILIGDEKLLGTANNKSELDTKPLEGVEKVAESKEHKEDKGLSSTTELPELVDETVERPSDLIKEDRFKIKDKTDNIEALYESQIKAQNKKEDFINELSEKYMDVGEENSYIEYTLSKVIKYWDTKPSRYGFTGRAIIKEYLDKSNKDLSIPYLGTTVGGYLLRIGSDLVKYALKEKELVLTGEAKDVAENLFSNEVNLYAYVIAKIVGCDGKKLSTIAKTCCKFGLDFAKILNTNPYALLLISAELNFSDIENIALCIGVSKSKELEKERNIGILYDYTMNSSSSTIYAKRDLYVSKLGVSLTSKKFETLKQHGTYLTSARQSNILAYINSDLTKSDWTYPRTGWVAGSYGTVLLRLTPQAVNKAIDDFVDVGLGVEVELGGTTWISNSTMLEKEIYCYNKLYKLASRQYEITDGEIEAELDEFEHEKGFKLEEQQRKAGYLTRYGCCALSGPAGSGKTTASEVMVQILRRRNQNIVVKFATPTGKSAKRLQEVVKQSVRTMHSMFGVFGNQNDLFDDADEDVITDEPDAYIFDEFAMVTIDLLYSVLKRISRAQLFFLGDISQLPPIGKGLPFKNMLSFLPCVFLNVTKRSAEGSGITFNSKAINENSEDSNWVELKNTDDFKLVECADDDICEWVFDICSHYLKGTEITRGYDINLTDLTPDDIQIVSPINAKYSWSAGKLNDKVRDLFVPKETSAKFYQNFGFAQKEYRIGDRVIHTSNNYTMRHYKYVGNNKLQMLKGNGIMNGDVGTILGVLDSNDCEFIKNLEEDDDNSEQKRELRDDESYTGEDKLFILVEYPDYELGGKFCILYRGQVNNKLSTDSDMVIDSMDLSSIQLAYALTVHKMQGSQSKLILFVVGGLKRKGFITRNLVYTGVSRSKDGSYLIGSVSNDKSSALSVARRLVASDKTNTVIDVAVNK